MRWISYPCQARQLHSFRLSEGNEIVERKAIEMMLDSIEWHALPEPDGHGDDVPYATHEGDLEIDGAHLRCYTLNDGQRIINAEDVEALFGTETD